jgi:hypothetical protein
MPRNGGFWRLMQSRVRDGEVLRTTNNGARLGRAERTPDRRAGAWMMACWALHQTGCSVLVDSGREQCQSNLDCRVRGIAFAQSVCIDSLCQADPDWACAGSLDKTGPQEALSVPITMNGLATAMPVLGAELLLCNRTDFDCTAPVAQTTSDELGKALLDFPAEFAGYISVRKDGEIEPTLVFPNLPMVAGEEIGPLILLGPNGGATLATQLGIEPKPGTGAAFLGVRNCHNQPGLGAEMAYQGNLAGAQAFYSFNYLPSRTATAVDTSGAAGLVNLEPGFLGVQSNIDGRAMAELAVVIHANMTTVGLVRPGYGELSTF